MKDGRKDEKDKSQKGMRSKEGRKIDMKEGRKRKTNHRKEGEGRKEGRKEDRQK